MSGQSGGHRLCLSKLNEQLTCKLCGGYFIDATTIIECLHSFCRSCIVKYLENNKYCPICEVQVHKNKPLLNIRPDHTLQDIVYKLVPGCYQNEMRCRREFYAKHPDARSQATTPEARGEPVESHIYSPDESLSLSLQYYNPSPKDNDTTKESISKPLPRRYLRCPAAVTVFHLQKLIRAKYGLRDVHRVDIMYKDEPLNGSYTLMDVMYIYHWRRKVPLHLSYRIFESSPKRIKLSEDNINYKKSLTNSGIDYVEFGEQQSINREWKEVQLKISESGVMSITNISNPDSKKNTRMDETKEQATTEDEATQQQQQQQHKIDSATSTKDASQTVLPSEATQAIQATQATQAIQATQVVNCSTSLADTKNSFCSTASDLIPNVQSSENSIGRVSSSNSQETTNKCSEDTQDIVANAKSTQKAQETEDAPLNNNINNTLSPQSQQKNSVQCYKATSGTAENGESKQLPLTNINNNISAEVKAASQKANVKNLNEVKTVNAGSKIDALSAKLQFQPKIGQVNNTYSKRASKEKKVSLQNEKKSEIAKPSDSKSTDTSNARTRTNCTVSLTKTAISNAPSQQQQQTSPSMSCSTTHSAISPVSASRQETSEMNSSTCDQGTAINVQQALNLLDQRINTSEAISTESTQTIPITNANLSPKSQQVRNNNSTSSESPVCPSSHSLTTTTTSQPLTFPYAVQDMLKNLPASASNSISTSSPCQKLTTTGGNSINCDSVSVSCTLTDNQACSPTQFSVQTPSMSIYSMSTSKNSYVSVTQSTTTTTMARQGPAKGNFEVSGGVYSMPPCPDAIPISLMKPQIRKQEVLAKGTNLNEICAKIGTSGSKINDICAKIGENSKEKSKVETRTKADIPDLLKIAKKGATTVTVSDSAVKHIPNIPNVPIYNPNSSNADSKNTHTTNVKDSASGVKTSSTPLTSTTSIMVPISHGSQKGSFLKKQNQSAGYKTLRDPPKSWNPTLSKNNYVAVKNQTKELQNTQSASSEGTSKPIPSKPAKIFKMRNVPRYLGNPASGVKPMYGVTNESKEKEQSSSKGTSLNMMKIDPKTLSPIVSTSNSPIVSPPPYSPNARSYQNIPFSRELCRNTSSPISPRNSPVNMLSTNPFIPSPTPNTNPRLIYSHFPPPFPDASRFPNPLIRSPIGIPPPTAFHSSLPPSINKLYQRNSYIPQTSGAYASSVASQPPTVQRIPPSTHSSPKPSSPKTSSPGIIVSSPPSTSSCCSSSPSSSSSSSSSLATCCTSTTTATISSSSASSTSTDVGKTAEPQEIMSQTSSTTAASQDHNAFNLSKNGSPRTVSSSAELSETSSSTTVASTSADATTVMSNTPSSETSEDRKESENQESQAKVNGDVTAKSKSIEKTVSLSEKPEQNNDSVQEENKDPPQDSKKDESGKVNEQQVQERKVEVQKNKIDS